MDTPPCTETQMAADICLLNARTWPLGPRGPPSWHRPGNPRRPPLRDPPRPSLPVSTVDYCPDLAPGPSASASPCSADTVSPVHHPRPGGLPRRPPSGVLQGKGVQIVCRSTSNTRRRHHSSKGMLFNPPHFYNVHGPVRNGVLADIVLVDPHMHACAHGFTTSQQ